ncbi:MAG: hypothetical protein IT285_12460 [Bdellovibrionales bacterium]|nr:hypothetical protein [Bdellovibrionales bacterium]
MKTFLVITAALGMVLISGAPMAQAQECEQQVNELQRQVRDLQQQIAQLTGGSGQGQTRRTTTGAVFTRVAAVHRDFGESWRDPSGMIWGDIAKNANGSIRYMDQYQATEYCQNRGGQLPSREDFVRLREYMGARSGTYEGYTPQVLPNLTRNVNGSTYSNYFWSSSVHPDVSYVAYDFGGRHGYIDYYYRYYVDDGAVRCVARR